MVSVNKAQTKKSPEVRKTKITTGLQLNEKEQGLPAAHKNRWKKQKTLH